MDYKVDQIINESDRHELIDLYNSTPSRVAHQDYNLYKVDKRPVYSFDGQSCNAISKIMKHSGKETYSHYFVMYEPGSYTRMHSDNDEDVGLTIVTLVDAVNLIGGDTLVMLQAPKEDKNGYQKGDDHKGRVMPKIVQMNTGDSVIYDRSLLHGVTQIEQGKRLVLVSWFKA